MTKILPVLAAFLTLLEVIVINQLAGSGQSVSAVEENIELVTEQNAALEQQVASASSLLTIEKIAKEYGFTESLPSSYINVEEYLPIAYR